jgi:outer membrane protein OmpA-like peptidoglycan-associated protein
MIIKTTSKFIHKKLSISVFLILFFSPALYFSQATINVSKLAKQGEKFIEKEEWLSGYQIFDSIVKSGEKNPFFKFKQGECGIHLTSKKQETIAILETAWKESPSDHIILYYLGRAYHHDYQFEKANSCFDKYLAYHDDDQIHVKEAEHYRRYCLNGTKLLKKKNNVEIKNIGKPINTDDDEYVPVLTADEAELFFTYKGIKSVGGKQNERFNPDQKNGNYYEDIFYSKKLADSTWSKPKSIEKDINTKYNDACIALSPDGQELYTFHSDEKNEGDIHKCVLKGDIWSEPQPLNKNINTDAWEGSCSISADGRLLFFSSERADGFGKKDIYVSAKQNNGDWGPAKNLGALINTEDDEDDPFISTDGTMLFFSSNGHKSIGGFDVMYSLYKDAKWQDAQNMGFPLNTTDDDRYFVLNAKGDVGYFSSNRDSKVKLNQDIFTYTTNFETEKPVLALIKGSVYGNDEPIESTIEIIRKKTKSIIGPFHSNAKTGNYLVTLSQDETYTFIIKAEGYAEYKEDFVVPHLTFFTDVKKDFYLYRNNFVSAKNKKEDSLTKLIADKIDQISTKKTSVAANDTIKKATEIKEETKKPNDNISSAKPALSDVTFVLHFDFNKAVINKDEPELKNLLEFLNKNKGYKIIITGHTDERGSSEYNQKLSERRANAVRNFIVSNKFNASKIAKTIGKGEEELLVACPGGTCDETVHSKNRRVEIKLVVEK